MTDFLPGILGPRMHLHTFSGGLGTFLSAMRLVEQRSTTDHMRLFFTDVLIEDNDTYRFLIEGAFRIYGRIPPSHLLAAATALPPIYVDIEARRTQLANLRNDTIQILPELIWIADGRTPFEVFRDVRFLGNSLVDPCSRILKRSLAAKWMASNCDKENTTIYLGIDWTEAHRLEETKRNREGWDYQAPLCNEPFFSLSWKKQILSSMEAYGVRLPNLYADGHAHGNCGGACVKAGQAAWARLLRTNRALFIFWEEEEQAARKLLGDVAILKDRHGGVSRPLTLREFRMRLEAGSSYDRHDIGGCGCFVGIGQSDHDQT